MKNILLLLGLMCFVHAQSANSFLKAGFANYDGFHMGFGHQLKNLEMAYALGTDFNLYQQGTMYNFNFDLKKRFLQKHWTKKTKAYVALKQHIWQIENPSNLFRIYSLNPLLVADYRINKIEISVFGGPIWSSVFQYERKGYQEVGFPIEWSLNFGVCLKYYWHEK